MNPPDLPKVLCVDDDPALLRALCWLLRDEFDVTVAQDGTQALALLRVDSFDVIVSDQRMPGMSGAEFLQQARALTPHSVGLLLTGYADFGAVVRALNEGEVFRFISKPWDNHTLLQAVQEAARQARMRRVGCSDVQDTATEDPTQQLEENVLLVQAEAELVALCASACRGLAGLLVVRDAADALMLLAQRRMAVLVVQHRPGSIETATLVRSIQRNCPLVSIVVCSAQPDIRVLQGLINECLIHRYVPLPADAAQLRQGIEHALRRHAELSARTQWSGPQRSSSDTGTPQGHAPARALPQAASVGWWQRLLRRQ